MGEKFNQLSALVYKSYIYKKWNLTGSLFSVFMGVLIGIAAPEDVIYQNVHWLC